MLVGMSNVAYFHFPSTRDSVKPNLLCSIFYFVQSIIPFTLFCDRSCFHVLACDHQTHQYFDMVLILLFFSYGTIEVVHCMWKLCFAYCAGREREKFAYFIIAYEQTESDRIFYFLCFVFLKYSNFRLFLQQVSFSACLETVKLHLTSI